MFTRIFYLLAALVVFVQASGDFVLLHTPDGVTFKGNKEIDQSLLKELFSASLGFTVKQKSTWTGMAISSPFNLPEAVVAIAVEGVDSLGAIKGKKFPLNVDEVEETTWQALSGRLEERDSDNTLVRIYLGDGLDALGQSALGELKPSAIDESSLKAMNLKSDEDRKFLDEVQLLRAIAKKVPTAISADDKPDVYWLVVSGLKSVFDVHGKNSLAAKEALTLLNEALHDVSKTFMDAYKNQVLIAAFTNDASQVRHTRSVMREKRQTKEPKADGEKKDGEKETQKQNEQNETMKEKVPESGSDTKDSKENSEKEGKNNDKDSKENSEIQNSEKEGTNNAKDSKESSEKEGKNNAKDSKESSEKEGKNNAKDSKESSEKESKNNAKDSKENSEKESKNDSKESAETVDKQNKHNTKDSKENSDKPNHDTTPDAHNDNDSQHPITPPEPNKMNLAKNYDENYPVIFNIMLWFGVVFFFSLLAICIFIADMDPGRDSIIYRMTSNRMKKDN